MNRFNAKTMVWTVRNLALVAGIMLFASGCGNAEIPGLADLKKNALEVFKSLTTALEKVAKDPKSAESVLPDLTKAEEAVTKISPLFEKMPEAGKEQIIQTVKEIYGTVKKKFDEIKGKIDVAKFKDTMTDLLKKLAPLAGIKG